MRTSRVLNRLFTLLPALGFLGVLLARCIFWDLLPNADRPSLYVSLTVFAGVFALTVRLRRKGFLSRLLRWRWFWIMAWGILFLPRLAVVLLFHHLTPADDAVTYLNIAKALTSPTSFSETIFSHYISVFPHFLAYPALILLARDMTFGAFSLVTTAQLLNLGLSLCIGGLLCLTVRNVSGQKAGRLAFLLWAVWPSQIFYTALPLSELPYVCSLLGVLCLISLAARHWADKSRAALCLLCAALLCAVANFIRPLAVVLFSGLLLWLLLGKKSAAVQTDCMKKPAASRALLCALALSCALLYSGGGALLRLGQKQTIGRESASFAMGWNMLDGNNESALGKWNAEDAALFKPLYEQVQRDELTPDALHRTLFDLGWTRLADRKWGNIPFWGKKLVDLWSRDENALVASARMKPELGLHGQPVWYPLLRGMCNGFYMAVVLWLVLVLFFRFARSFRRPEGLSFVHLPLIYLLGMTAAHMILEQGQRYAFPGAVMMVTVIAMETLRDSSAGEHKEVFGQRNFSKIRLHDGG